MCATAHKNRPCETTFDVALTIMSILFSSAVPFYGVALYCYYHGIVQHSGIAFKARWWQPWQPDCMFHDNHHQYCHVNYGFNCYLWDEVWEMRWKREEPVPLFLPERKNKNKSIASTFCVFIVTDPRIREEDRPLLQRTHGLVGFW